MINMETTIPIIETALPYNAVILPQPEIKPEPIKQKSNKLWYVLIGALFITAFLGALVSTASHQQPSTQLVQAPPSITTQIIRFLDSIGLGQADLGTLNATTQIDTGKNTTTIDMGKNTTTINQGKNSTSTTTIQPTTTIPINNTNLNKTYINQTINATVDSILANFTDILEYNQSLVLTLPNGTKDLIERPLQFNVTAFSNTTALTDQDLKSIYAAASKNQTQDASKGIVLYNKTLTLQYGSLKQNGDYVLPNSELAFAAYDTHIFTLYKVNVTKAQAETKINVGGATLGVPNSTTVVTPLILPFGIHQGQWHLSGSFNSSALNKLTWTYSIVLTNIRNGTQTKLRTGSATGTSIHIPYDYWLPVNVIANATLDTLGNANYSAIDPSGIILPSQVVKYRNLTFTNGQAVATANGFQQMITFNSLGNSTSLGTNNQNVEFFYNNGTVATSWCESNCTSSSRNTIYYIKDNIAIAGSSTQTNAISMGFALTSTNFLSATGTTGSNPTTTTTYGQYDNGNVIFNFYCNYQGTTLCSNMATISGSPVISNGISMSLISAVASTTTFNAYNTIQDDFGYFNNFLSNAQNFRYGSQQDGSGLQEVYISGNTATSKYALWTYPGGAFSSSTDIAAGSLTRNNIFSFSGNVLTAFAMLNYTSKTTLTATMPSDLSGSYVSLKSFIGDNLNAQWSRVRLQPPNFVMPSAKMGALVDTTPVIAYVINISVSVPSGTLLANTPIEWNLPMGTYNNIIKNGSTNINFANTLNDTLMSGKYGVWFQNITSNTQVGGFLPLWFKLPYALPQGIAKNVIQMRILTMGSQSQIDGNIIGAPQYALGGSCGTFDNGANVFGIYDSFCYTANAFGIKWLNTNAIANGNGATLANSATTVKLNYNGLVSSGNVLELFGGFQNTATSNKGSFGYNTLNTANPTQMVLQAGWGTAGISTGTANQIAGRLLIVTYGLAANQVIGMWTDGANTFTTNRIINNVTIVGAGFNTKTTNALPVANVAINITLNSGNAASASTQFIQWFRDRQAPTNNKMPTILTGAEDVPIVITSVTPNPANVYDSGQSIPFTVYWTGGVGTFTANWIVYNTITKAVIGNALYSGIAGGTPSNTFNFLLTNRTAWGNTIAANVMVFDGVFNAIANSVTQSIFVNTTGIPTLYPQRNITVDIGQNITFNADIGHIFGFSSGAVYGVNDTLANVYIANGIHLDRVGMACTAGQETQVAGWSASNYVVLGIGFGQGCGNIISLPDWNASVANVIRLYPTIHQWEVLNEPTNTKQQYNNNQAANIFNLTRAAAINIKKLEPNSTVVCGGGLKLNVIANVVDYGVAQYMVANGILNNCDAFSLHSYFGNGRNYTFVQPSGNTIQADVDTSLNIWHTLLGNTPIWITETGVVGNVLGGGSSTLVTPINQIAFMQQAFATFTNRTYIDKIFWYAGAGFGCLYNGTLGTVDYAPKPCYNEFLYWNNNTAAVPYSFNYIISNAIGGQKVANALYGGITMPYNSFVWTPTGSAIGKVFHGKLTITDAASTPVTRNSLFSQNIYVNAAMGVSSFTSVPSPSLNVFPSNSIVFTVTISGGTSPYTFNYTISNTVTNTIVANMLYVQVSSTTNSFSWSIPAATVGNTLQANVIVTDNATTPTSIVTSNLKTYTVQAAPAPTLSIPTNPLTYGTTETITFSSNGMNSDWVELLVNGQIVAPPTQTTNTYTFNQVSLTPVGVYTLNAFDVNSMQGNIISLTVQRASEILSCTYIGQSAVNGAAFSTVAASGYANCTSSSIANQISPRFRYNGATIIFNTTERFNTIWNDSNNMVQWNNQQTANYLANSIMFNALSARYIPISNTVPSSPVYETSLNTWIWNYNISKAATSANFIESRNNVNQTVNSVSIQAANQLVYNYFTVPIATANNLVSTYNGFIQLAFANGTLKSSTINTIKQTVLQAYFTTATVQYSNIILGENQTVNVITQDVSGLNSPGFTGSLTIGTTTGIPMSTINSLIHYSNIYSVIPASYGLANPGFLGTVNVPVTVVVGLSSGGNTVYRNTSTSFFSTFEAVGTCNAIYPTNTLVWKFYNSNDLFQFNGNVYMSGYFQIVKNTWTYNSINGTNAGFPPIPTATANTYSTCIFPSWAGGHHAFQVNGQYNYNASISAGGHFYFIRQTISNVLQQISLYLQYVPSPMLYNIAVKNSTTSSYVASMVQIQQFIPNSNTSIVVQEIQTPAGGSAQAYLSVGTQYRFAVYNPVTGALRKLTGYTTAASCLSPPCSLIIYLGTSNITSTGTYFNNILENCTQSPGSLIGTPTAYNITITCSFSTTNSTAYSWSLQVIPNSLLNNTVSCSQTANSVSTGTLTCTVGSTNNTAYHWSLKAYTILGASQEINFGAFGYSSLPFGNTGLFAAFIIFLVLAFIFLPKNVIIVIMMSDAAVVGAWLLQLLPTGISLAVIGGLQLLVAALIWVVTRP